MMETDFKGWIAPGLRNRFEQEGTTAHRLFSSRDAWIEKFGPDVLISHRDAGVLSALEATLALWTSQEDLVVERLFSRVLPKHNEERSAPTLLRGASGVSRATVIHENRIQYGIDFSAGYSVGLFLDQRANRASVRRMQPGRLLNCFAYTCSFSVCAALAGAATVNIDLSRKSLARGRDNFALNDLPLSGHRFLADDVLEVLPRMGRKGEQFDTIILDPPTFSRGAGRRKFQAERNLDTLLMAALDVAAHQARILISTNCSTMDARALDSLCRFCLKTRRRAAHFHREPELPDVPRQYGAETLWLLLR